MNQYIEEMAIAAKLVEHEHFMGVCEGGFPLLAFADECAFCGADHTEACRRAPTVSPKDQ